ncbi:hypothetical protein Hypma_004796 [Hypsizygus marmoreus]|uniref:Protein kinase domain-containing protein n=1 Tax=Hypsizygus marmoreus TaxID=39966 RepID=A0A369IZV3_HYPMA|nr:hypothetical protein Hypma_004796 [Hypsizygus marmoreus]
MGALWLGPMPVQEFLDEFLPLGTEEQSPPFLPTYFGALETTMNEFEIYKPFIQLVENDTHNLIPGFKFVDTSDHDDIETCRGEILAPQLAMYRNDVDARMAAKTTLFHDLEVHFKFKSKDISDPFDDPPPDIMPEERLKWQFAPRTDRARYGRSQLASYVNEWCTLQHRVHAFSVFIAGTFARFIRWDRSGAVVSEKFDFKKTSQPLVDFLWRFARLDSDTLRGRDETVRMADEEEIDLACAHLSQWCNDYERPAIVLRIEEREFIAWGCMSDAGKLTGRATRAYPVYEKATGEISFLKDSWRAVDLEKESDILLRLNEAGVRNVPKFICGGDVDITRHTTRSHLYGGKSQATIPGGPVGDHANVAIVPPLLKKRRPWVCGHTAVTQRVHHRFTEDLIGMPLIKFASSKHLMAVVRDAFIAHQDAYTLCGILHRDISANNILIHPDGHGILNDWDMAKTVSDLPDLCGRIGTWRFISCPILVDFGKIHTVQDDIESFVLVVLYIVLRYLRHSGQFPLKAILDHTFDDSTVYTGDAAAAGYAKGTMFVSGGLLGSNFTVDDNTPLTEWLMFAFAAVTQWHRYFFEKKHRRSALFKDDPPPSTLDKMMLTDHTRLLSVWESVLSLSNWPSNDKAIDFLAKEMDRSSFGDDDWEEGGFDES